ncbi:hypothetical protein EU245_14675 [Lentibacillus lipolyticus]|nr:hypothetical protein EU245_14675 [Lentibacillus lipolyticus]
MLLGWEEQHGKWQMSWPASYMHPHDICHWYRAACPLARERTSRSLIVNFIFAKLQHFVDAEGGGLFAGIYLK